MAVLEIGLKVNTLPVVALGVGIGVDYGIYLYSRFRALLPGGRLGCATPTSRRSRSPATACSSPASPWRSGVATWMFSPLKFQADMGLLLAFLFLMNMVGAMVLLPALASLILHDEKRHQS